LALAVVASTVSLGWSIAEGQEFEATVFALHSAFAVYVFVLSVSSVRQEDTESHAESIIHLAVLSMIAFLLLGSIVILPESPQPVKAFVNYRVLRPQSFAFDTLYPDVVIVFVYTSVCILTFKTPLGPLLHYPPSNIYSEKTVQSITNTDKNNVCGVTSPFDISLLYILRLTSLIIGGSLWDLILFSYTTKVVWLGNIASTLDIGDLPIVPANMRSTYNYAAMRKIMRTVRLRTPFWIPKPGSGWQLSWQLVRLNYLILTAELILAAVSAILFYTPAYFLQHFVLYLEVEPGKERKQWGWVYVIGLFGTNAIVFLS